MHRGEYLHIYIYINRGYIMGGFVYDFLSMSEDVISATSERSERVADIISEHHGREYI